MVVSMATVMLAPEGALMVAARKPGTLTIASAISPGLRVVNRA